MSCNHPLKEIFRQHAKSVQVFIGKETIIDQEEQSVEIDYLNPIPIKGLLVDEMTPAQYRWKIDGRDETNAEVIIFQAHHRTTLELSHKLEIEGKSYYGYKNAVGVHFQIKRLGWDYIQVYTVQRDDTN